MALRGKQGGLAGACKANSLRQGDQRGRRTVRSMGTIKSVGRGTQLCSSTWGMYMKQNVEQGAGVAQTVEMGLCGAAAWHQSSISRFPLF